MTKAEAFVNTAVNNSTLTLITRLAPTVLLAIFMWLANNAWDNYKNQMTLIDTRLNRMETKYGEQHDQLTDLGFRAVAGKAAREQLTADTKAQFAEVNGKLDALGSDVIRIQSTLENRLPLRTGNNEVKP